MDLESIDPKDDPRSVDDLFNAALVEPDEILAWDAVMALHEIGTREVLDRALSLCAGACPFERARGADVLGKLTLPEPSESGRRLRALLEMLEQETDAGALQAILAALGHQAWSAEAVSAAADRSAHPDPEVRDAVVHALMGLSDPRAIESLIELSRDPEPHVRDWATFALGSQIDDDTPAIREALAARLADEDEETQAEAVVGLARRGDRRALPCIRDELTSGRPMILHVEAAALIAEPELHPLLLALRGRWDADPRGLEDAIRACTPG
ncbi:HEAT repeat domain-containing protein [Paludisphaera soli]|uniref:HEAT repeat domain-containing protein n=1 Tax=Paludisphaera soli TaxID=2712865 RepID=UPI001F0F41FC|nr:HEAT repeat domain-containing protein [Paludisphaera soli]